jgi:alpha-tubulin suppressor-like RCC1 family protein
MKQFQTLFRYLYNKSAFVWIFAVGQLISGCAYDYSNYFTRHGYPALLQFGKQNDSVTISSFAAISKFDFSQQPFGASITKPIYIVNTGELPATNIQVSVDSPQYTFQNKCVTLPAGAKVSCEVDITFSPLVFDKVPANLKVTYNDSAKVVTTSLPITATSMRWAFLKFTPIDLSQPTTTTTAGTPSIFLLHVFYSGDLLIGKPDHDQIPPAEWTSLAAAVTLGTKTTTLTPSQTVIPSGRGVFTLSTAAESKAVGKATGATMCPNDEVTQSCNIAVTFIPDFATGGHATDVTAEADFLGNIGLQYYNGESATNSTTTLFDAHGYNTIIVNPFAITAVTTSTPSAVAFSPTTPGKVLVNVVNTGGTNVPGQNLTYTVPNQAPFSQTAADVTASTCKQGGTIPVVATGQTACVIQLTFNPVVSSLPAVPSITYTDKVTVSYNFADHQRPVMPTLSTTVSGIGAQPAQLMLTDTSGKALPTVQSSGKTVTPLPAFTPTAAFQGAPVQNFLLQNVSGLITANSIAVNPKFSDGAFGVTPTCQVSLQQALAPTLVCPYYATFTSPDANSHSGQMAFTYDNGSTQFAPSPIYISASGTGTAAPVVLDQTGDGKTFNLGNYMYGQRFADGTSNTPAQSLQLNIYGINAFGGISLSSVTGNSGFSITSKDCFNQVAAATTSARSCNLLLSYAVPATGTAVSDLAETFNYTYYDGSATRTVSIMLKVRTEPRPVVHFAVQGQLPGQMTGDQSGPYTINNSSSSNPTAFGNSVGTYVYLWNDSPDFDAHIQTLALGTGGPEFALSSNACANGVVPHARDSTTIKGTGTCQYFLGFKPLNTDNGSMSGSYPMIYKDEVTAAWNTVKTQTMTAYATTTISPQPNITAINFGTVYINSNNSISVTFTPVGYASPTWYKSFDPLPSHVTISMNSCANPLNTGGGATCQIVFLYSPTSTSDGIPSGASANLNYVQTPSTPGAIKFTFSGSPSNTSAKVGISQANFGKVFYQLAPQSINATQKTQNVLITNNSSGSSGATATFKSASILPADGNFQYSPDTTDPQDCSTVGNIAPGASCNLRIIFKPNTAGTISPTLTVSYQDLGQGTAGSVSAPLLGIGTVPIHVYAGTNNTCITDETQQAVCWGANDHGQLGQGNFNDITTIPQTKINFGAGVTVAQLAVGSQHVCAILNTPTSTGVVSCWGGNKNGRLGLGISPTTSSANNDQNSPLSNSGLNLVKLGNSSGSPAVAKSLSAGYEHTCALLTDGNVKCWGGNAGSQLGNLGTTDVGGSPSDMGANLASVNLSSKAVSVAAGASHTCAVLNDGSTYCWGTNGNGQVGKGVLDITIATPSLVQSGSSGASSVQASQGMSVTCLLRADKSVKCFGQSSTPDTVNPSGVTSDGFFYGILGFCVTRAGNDYGQPAELCWNAPKLLPPTDRFGILASDMVAGLSTLGFSQGVNQLALGGTHGCALFANNSVGCWGSNSQGQLGNGSAHYAGERAGDLGVNLQIAATSVIGATPYEVAAGALHTCVAFSDNTLKCWGGDPAVNGHGTAVNNPPVNAVGGNTTAVYNGQSP